MSLDPVPTRPQRKQTLKVAAESISCEQKEELVCTNNFGEFCGHAMVQNF